MHELVTGLIGAVGVPLIIFLWQTFLKRETVQQWGIRIGRFFSRILGQKIGIQGSRKIRDRILSTVEDLIQGIYTGMDEEYPRAPD